VARGMGVRGRFAGVIVGAVALIASLVLTGTAGAQSDDETEVSTTLLYVDDSGDRVLAEGVEVRVEDAGGDEVGTDETDSNGEATVEVPGAGEYTMTLDTDTLPDGVVLRTPDRDSVSFDVSPGETQFVLFALELAGEDAPEDDEESEVADEPEDESDDESSSAIVIVLVAVVLVGGVVLVISRLRRRGGSPKHF
jgi:neutral amino acid transport system permease protein